ncbi:hypothetical protein Y032_0049g1862 [Ancylostoma ceylanicum]|nr:hypothetical protein Y032_0049g1862 [Ancylostoma ceylanicum]
MTVFYEKCVSWKQPSFALSGAKLLGSGPDNSSSYARPGNKPAVKISRSSRSLLRYGVRVMDDTSAAEAANNNHVKLSEAQLVYSEFGAPLDECYRLAVKFYKEKEKSGELAVSYDDRVMLMALSKQVRLGPFADNSDSAGFFDLLGNDIAKAWRDLGQRSRDDSMASFIFLMDRVCPPFKNFIADHVEPAA